MIEALHDPYVVVPVLAVIALLALCISNRARDIGCALIAITLLISLVYLVAAYFLIFCIILFILALIGGIMLLISA